MTDLCLLDNVLDGIIILLLIVGMIYYAYTAQKDSQALKQTLAQLGQAHSSLLQQDKLASLGTLVAGISHEVQNPLNFIRNFSELSLSLIQEMEKFYQLQTSTLSDEERKECLENFKTLQNNLQTIYQQSHRAQTTLQRMLLHARSQSEEQFPTNLHELLNEYLTLSYQSRRAREPTFRLQIEKSFLASSPIISINAEEMSRVFLNLFSNAYDALYAKKQEQSPFSPLLKVTTASDAQYFYIRIRDNGCGIAKNHYNKIFSPFFTTKAPDRGTGLGLSLSRSIIDRHGGKLSFESEEGHFTEFTLSLPLKQ